MNDEQVREYGPKSISVILYSTKFDLWVEFFHMHKSFFHNNLPDYFSSHKFYEIQQVFFSLLQ